MNKIFHNPTPQRTKWRRLPLTVLPCTKTLFSRKAKATRRAGGSIVKKYSFIAGILSIIPLDWLVVDGTLSRLFFVLCVYCYCMMWWD